MDEKSKRFLGNASKASIFRTLIRRGPMSRVELSKQLPLSKMSVTNYINELIADGLVHETGTMTSESGRKPVLLDVSGSCPLFVSVQITRFYISVGIINCKGRFQNINMSPIEQADTNSSVFSKIVMLLDQVLTPEVLERTWAIGASSMGPVSCDDGAIFTTERPDVQSCIQIREPLEQRYGIPVYVNNDVNTLVFAEKYFGSAGDYETFAVVGSSVGLGCGLMVRGQLYCGENGLGAALGHVTVEVDGRPCYCGNRGCLEQYASIPAVTEWARAEFEKRGAPCAYNNWQDFLSGVEQGDEICRLGFERLVKYLGAGLVTLVNLFNPGCIFLGECYAQAAPLLAAPLEQYIRDHQFFPRQVVTEVKGSRFMGTSPLIGPAAFAMHRSLNP